VIEVGDGESFKRVASPVGSRGIGSLLLEGGAAIHRAAWDGGVVDYVRLYVTPHVLGPAGVSFLSDRDFSSAALLERRVEPVGQDTVIEGYVSRASLKRSERWSSGKAAVAGCRLRIATPLASEIAPGRPASP